MLPLAGLPCVRSVDAARWPPARRAGDGDAVALPVRAAVRHRHWQRGRGDAVRALAGTVEGWRTLRNRSSGYCGERPNFRCAPFLAANRRGNPNLSGTVCRTALACLTAGHMSVFPAARNGRPPAYSPQPPAGGRSRAGAGRRAVACRVLLARYPSSLAAPSRRVRSQCGSASASRLAKSQCTGAVVMDRSGFTASPVPLRAEAPSR